MIICLRQSQRWIHDKSTNEHQWLCGNSPAADQTCGFLTHTGEFGQAEACRRLADEFNFLTFQHAAAGSGSVIQTDEMKLIQVDF